jgi:hypothetical protein
MGLTDYLWFVKGLYRALTACLDYKSSFIGRNHDSQTVRRLARNAVRRAAGKGFLMCFICVSFMLLWSIYGL